MATTVLMPKLGLTMQEGTVIRWLRQPGDAVSAGTPLCEIETDKIANEVEAPAGGQLLQILVPAGETVPCLTPLCLIGAAGEVPDGAAPAPAPAAAAPPAAASGPASAPGPAPAGGERRRISPLARKAARSAGIDVAGLTATGRSGRIVLADVERAIAAQATAPTTAPTPAVPADAPATVPTPAVLADAPLSLSAMRQTIARRMTASLRETAQLTLTTTVEADALVDFRKQLVAQTEASLGFRVGYNEFIVRAAALALARHPEIAVAWGEGGPVQRSAVHVGIAVDVPGGLLVPVLRHADRLSLSELHRQIAALAESARAGSLSREATAGGVISISNLGHLGIEAFTPILNPPESAILGVGALRTVPVVREGAVVPGHELVLSLTVDHRLIDGAPGARFLATIRHLLEHPARLTV